MNVFTIIIKQEKQGITTSKKILEKTRLKVTKIWDTLIMVILKFKNNYKMRIKTIFTIIYVLGWFVSFSQTPKNDMMLMLDKAPGEAAFKCEGYWVWGSSVVKGNDGQYHMFASRWSKDVTFHPGWMIQSEIVHATSINPEGPYTFKDIALPARGAQYWDGRATHNPKIVKYKDTYILFYMGSTHPFADFAPEDTLKLKSKYSIVGRSNKRIGVAWSKSPNGPWERLDKPVLDVKPNTFYSFLTSNPAPWINEDGSVLLLFKSRGYSEQFPYQSAMKIGVAKAPHFKGPYTVDNDKPIFGEGDMAEIEDPTLWKDEHGYHILAKDQRGKITGHVGHGIIANSKDGISWKLDEKPYAYTKTIRWDDGTKTTMGQLERVSVLLDENNKITHLFFATMNGSGGFNNSTKSWNIVVPLKK